MVLRSSRSRICETPSPTCSQTSGRSTPPPSQRVAKKAKVPSGDHSQDARLLALPSDVLAHIVELLPNVEMVARCASLCRTFPFPTITGGCSIIEEAMRRRWLAHTGAELPIDRPLSSYSDTRSWSWTQQLMYLERCRRGIVLRPQKSQRMRTGTRRPIFLVRTCCRMTQPCTILLGRTTRVVDNGQGITDPRVSRRHAQISLLQGVVHNRVHDPAKPADGDAGGPPWDIAVARVEGIGHNPSRIVRNSARTRSRATNFSSDRKLKRTEHSFLFPGDELHLVCEDVSRAHGRSAAFEGNACAYRVDLIREHEIEHLERAASESALSSGDAASESAIAEAFDNDPNLSVPAAEAIGSMARLVAIHRHAVEHMCDTECKSVGTLSGVIFVLNEEVD